MAYSFGVESQRHLRNLHMDLQIVAKEAIKYVDFAIIESIRDKETQDKYYKEGRSKTQWPNSKHNLKPGQLKSDAFDILPSPSGYPKDKKDTVKWAQFAYCIGVIRGCAEELRLQGKITSRLRFGFDFNSNDKLFDDDFVDAPHIERICN